MTFAQYCLCVCVCAEAAWIILLEKSNVLLRPWILFELNRRLTFSPLKWFHCWFCPCFKVKPWFCLQRILERNTSVLDSPVLTGSPGCMKNKLLFFFFFFLESEYCSLSTLYESAAKYAQKCLLVCCLLSSGANHRKQNSGQAEHTHTHTQRTVTVCDVAFLSVVLFEGCPRSVGIEVLDCTEAAVLLAGSDGGFSPPPLGYLILLLS